MIAPEPRVPLAPLTSMGVGGPARFFVRARGRAEVEAALGWATQRGLPVLVLGGGSNLVVADEGFDGLVVALSASGAPLHVEEADGRVHVRSDAGRGWDELVGHAVGAGWAGVECLSGIPGSVGATPIQNVGAYGQEVAETITAVHALDRHALEEVVLDRAACAFSYRDSAFKRSGSRFVVLEVTFALLPGGPPAVRYPELERALAADRAPTLAAVRDAVLRLRAAKSMLLDPGGENGRSAGSFFTNPVVAAADVEGIRERVRAHVGVEARMPEFPDGSGRVKLSAGWLIERAGFHKGWGEGRAGLSTRHCLSIVNRGGARAADVLGVARAVRDGVRERFGVRLVPEPELVGFAPEAIGDLFA